MAVIKHACTVYIIFMKDIDNENRPFKERLKKYIFIHNELLNEHKDLAGLILKQSCDISGDNWEYFRKIKTYVLGATIKMLESAVSKGEVRCQDVDLAAHMILGITATILRARLTENEFWDTDDVVDIIMHGISG